MITNKNEFFTFQKNPYFRFFLDFFFFMELLIWLKNRLIMVNKLDDIEDVIYKYIDLYN